MFVGFNEELVKKKSGAFPHSSAGRSWSWAEHQECL